MFLNGQTILITGAYGFLGRNLAKIYSDLGANIIGIGHGEFTYDELKQNGINSFYSDDVNLTNACPDTGRLGCNECGICQGDSTPIWYSDADADGKGDPETTLESCTALDGYV